MSTVTAKIKFNALDPIMKRPDVSKMLGISKSTLIRWTNSGYFPKPFDLGPRIVGWRQSTVDNWIDSRKEA